MLLTRTQTLPVPPAAAWTALTDVKILKACIPGCESLTALSSSEFAVSVIAFLGPLRTKFTGTLELRRHGTHDPPESYSLHFDGHGRFAGHTEGEALIELQPAADGNTVLRYAAKATLEGRLANLGAPFVDMAAQDLADTFFTAFNEQMRARRARN